MQLKTAENRAPDIEALEALRRRPDIDARTARMIEDEIWSIRLGAKAEADAAYQLDFDLKDSGHWAVIHDLRLDIEGQVAQIDHLVISRMLEAFVCESKSYSGGVKINEYGEWITFRDRRQLVALHQPSERDCPWPRRGTAGSTSLGLTDRSTACPASKRSPRWRSARVEGTGAGSTETT